jgi:acyl-CoA hydrolase
MRLVLCGEGPCEPSNGLLTYLSRWPPSLGDPVHVVFGMRRTPPPVQPSPTEGLTFGSLMPGRGLKAVNGLQYHRWSYSQVCDLFTSGNLRLDAAVACATRVARDGTRSLGAVNGYMQLAIDAAKVIILEEVDWLPSVRGAAKVTQWDAVVASDAVTDAVGPPLAKHFDPVDEVIAKRIVAGLHDDLNLSIGIGRIPSAVAHSLRGRAGIQLVGGAVTETIRQLHDTLPKSSRKPVRAMSVVGSVGLLDWASREEHVELLPSTAVHNPQWLGAMPNFVAILGALSVDRHGNVNSERVGRRIVSGVGGAPDFARGAHLSLGGKSVVALRSESAYGSPTFVDEVPNPTIRAEYVDAIASERGLVQMPADPSHGPPDLHQLFPSSALAIE